MAPRDGKLPSARRRTSLSRVLFSLAATFGLIGLMAGAIVLYGLKAANDPGPLAEPKTVIIEEGLRTPEIAALLEREGVIDNETLFTAAAHLTRSVAGNLKPGEYEFESGVSLAGALALIRSGRAVMHKVTIPEGWTTAQAVKRVEEHPALAGTVAEAPAEGTILPDTYLFRRGYSRAALLGQMRAAQAKLIDELWEKRASNLPVATKEEAVTLASIVEKETGVPSERPQVAAVFLNRLKKRMRLQSDPTIIYGIVGGKGRLDRPIRRSDIDTKTDYNTYRIDGLPPGPIANPGRESLAAVLQPQASDALYFVADGSGGHVFAATLAEHQRNVRKWRQIEREQDTDETGADVAASEDGAVQDGVRAADAVSGEQTPAVPTEPAQPETTPPQAEAPLPPTPEANGADKPLPEQTASTAETPPDPAPLPIGEPADSTADSTPKSGALVKVADRLVPIPRPKPKRD